MLILYTALYTFSKVLAKRICFDVNESDPCSKVQDLGSSENKAWKKKFRPVWDLNPWTLQYRCSALPTELTSQLGAGYDVGSK